MKLIDLHEEKSQFFKTRAEIDAWFQKMKISGYFINDDLTVDVIGNVNLAEGLFTHFPVQFGHVTGDFDCTHCINLVSLVGSPKMVNKSFHCVDNTSLKTLEGAPETIGAYFDCNCSGGGSSLISLKGGPKTVGKSFYCGNNYKLTSLEGSPEIVGEHFDCSACTSLKTLIGAPKEVGESFNCAHCESLASLEGCSAEIGHTLWANDCKSLTSLKDIHKSVKSIGEAIHVSNTPIKRNILGLLKIKNLKKLSFTNDKEVSKIINKYLPEGDMLDCVDELEDAGYGEYAKL